MPTFDEHVPGTFCYTELGTTDPKAAGAFYISLFDWSRRDEDAGELGVYTQFLRDKRITAAMYKLTAEQLQQQVPSNWCSYVSVADADKAAERAAALGGRVIMGPADIQDYGRMAVLADPTGAVFSVWQARANCGAGVKDEPGAMCWTEVMTDDPQRASEFYAELFGWRPQQQSLGAMGEYTMFMGPGGRPAGGLMTITPEMGTVRAHWLVYFTVSGTDAAHAKALALGAKSCVEPTDIPGMGRFAVLADPTGAVFGIFTALVDA